MHDPHRPGRRPDGLRPHRAGRQRRQGRPHRRAGRRHARRAGHRRDQHRDLLLPSQPARRRRCAVVHPDNAQGEYYLTDVVEVLAEAGHKVVSVTVAGSRRDPGRQRPGAAGGRRGRPAGPHEPGLAGPGRHHGRPGRRPTSTPRCTLAADVTIFPGTILQGRTTIGAGVEIGPGCRLVDCTVGEHTTLEHTVARLSEIGADCAVGPYAVLEPGIACAVRDAHRAVLHCEHGGRARGLSSRRSSAHSGTEGTHGAGHQEEAAPAGRAVEPAAGRRDRRLPRRGARSPEPRRSSPTARSTRSWARTCGAPTSSSSRPTAPPRTCR